MTAQRTILVTGGCGFIGSHMVDRLLADGHEVIVLDDLSTGSLANLAEAAVFYCGSVADKLFLDKLFAQHAVDAVIHEAARINTNVLIEEPRVDMGTSVLGTINLIEACLRHKVRKFIFASSVAVYGRPEHLPASEETRPAPIYSYGIAKLCAEEYVRFYGDVHGLEYHVLRYGNIYGPRQPIYGEVGVIAIFTQKVLNGEPLIVFGDGQHQRDFLYVDDAVEATAWLLDQPGSEIFNVARGEAVTVNAVFDAFQDVCGGDLTRLEKPERTGEIGKYYSSIAKLRTATGWRPRVDISTGIARTIEYCRSIRDESG